MCTRVTCSKCKRPTYAGCGAHVEQVLRGVPRDERCKCREARASDTKTAGTGRSWLRELLGK